MGYRVIDTVTKKGQKRRQVKSTGHNHLRIIEKREKAIKATRKK